MPRSKPRRAIHPFFSAADSYWVAAKRPLNILLFLLPLIIAYEVGLVVLLQSDRGVLTNQAHRQLLRFFDMFGLNAAGALHLGGIAIVIVLLLWHVLNRDKWKADGATLGMMLIESIALTLPLLVLAQVIARTSSHDIDMRAMTLAGGQSVNELLPQLNPWARITISVGAGLYEELVFRMLLIALIHTLLVDMGKASHALGATIAVVVSAAAFACYHPLQGPDGSLSWAKLVFFFLAGLYFGAIYAARGFGIVVAVHALYDTIRIAVPAAGNARLGLALRGCRDVAEHLSTVPVQLSPLRKLSYYFRIAGLRLRLWVSDIVSRRPASTNNALDKEITHMPRPIVLATAFTVVFATTGFIFAGDEPKEETAPTPLTVGDKAPKFDISNFIKGDAVKEFAPGKIYVMEFWATWCGPCKMSMPHISEMQEKYKEYGVTFIGVSDEPLDTVSKFLAKPEWDAKTKYTLATDPDKSVYTDYMKGASQSGIPTAFVIGKDAHVEWIGHPMELDDVMDSVVKGSWDRNAFKAKWEKSQLAEREANKLMRDLQTAQQAKDWDKVLSTMDKMIALGDQFVAFKAQKFIVMGVYMKDADKAYAYARQTVKENWDNAQLLNQFAWLTATQPGLEPRDLDFALEAATRADEVSGKDGAILDTVAKIYHDKGDFKAAVEWEKKAVANAPKGMEEELAKTLKEYEDEAAKN